MTPGTIVPARRRRPLRRGLWPTATAAGVALLATAFITPPGAASTPDARSAVTGAGLGQSLVAGYDFEHPDPADAGRERDVGPSGTTLSLVNGGAAMRVRDDADPRRGHVLQTRQVQPGAAGNDDWKAGVYDPAGAASMHAFNGTRQATVMGWFRTTGQNPSPNSGTADPSDLYNAIGLAGVLTGDSNGHDVRALLELIDVDGQLRLVALGRRVDGSASQTFAADGDWRRHLPDGQWVHLAATFDFDTGELALYRNGRALPGSYVRDDDPWALAGDPEPDLASPTDPRGIKIGGSFPQNTREANPCNCRMDDLLFLNRAATAGQVRAEYRRTGGHPGS
ncbi:LamG domain-containing protein [Streptomyces sp. NBC_01016]|uniref:LamG-like jellyroll fold domain-containing protein n=1 Tax=Streptomyces sp. NBC_01016 TaxID=2903720 RepID=UPI002250468C|nr:LamG-like jellyroll fold domain-containing protein [Streptomyces sp. NBC_01016]MCX4834748.1 LamG domain-containing protein [Streptomyces sp. NBC_01016]